MIVCQTLTSFPFPPTHPRIPYHTLPPAGPPNCAEVGNGVRVYFPWELHSIDYLQRGLALAREALHRVFKGALAAGKVGEMPVSTCRYRPQPDVYELIEAALAPEHEAALDEYLAELDREKEKGKDDDKAAAAPRASSLRERLEGIGASGAVPHKGSVSREELDYLLTEVLALAEGAPNAQDVADDARFLLEQFHAHSDSKSLRLRLLRVSQIRGNHLDTDGPGGSEGGPASAASADASSSRSAGAGGLGVSGGFSPVNAGGGVAQQFKFVQEHVNDLVLNDDT